METKKTDTERQYTIDEAVKHLHEGGAIENEGIESLNFLKCLLRKAFPNCTSDDTNGLFVFYFKDDLLETDWNGWDATDRPTIKLSQVSETTEPKEDEAKCNNCSHKSGFDVCCHDECKACKGNGWNSTFDGESSGICAICNGTGTQPNVVNTTVERDLDNCESCNNEFDVELMIEGADSQKFCKPCYDELMTDDEFAGRTTVEEKTECTCENPNDNCCDFCDQKETESILAEAKNRAKVLAKEQNAIEEAGKHYALKTFKPKLNKNGDKVTLPPRQTVPHGFRKYEKEFTKAFVIGANWQSTQQSKEMEEAVSLLKEAEKEIFHLKREYRDAGHCVKFLNKLDKFLDSQK